jgi:hypothetical protein
MFCLHVITQTAVYRKDRFWAWPCLQPPSRVWWMQLSRLLLRRCMWTTSPCTTVLEHCHHPTLASGRYQPFRCFGQNSCLFSRDQTKCSYFTRLGVLHLDSCLSLGNRAFPFVPTLTFLVSFLTASSSGSLIRYLRVKCGHWIFKTFMWTFMERRADSDAPALWCSHPLQDRLWQLHVWLRQEVQGVHNRPCSQYWSPCCHGHLSHQPSVQAVCGMRWAPLICP